MTDEFLRHSKKIERTKIVPLRWFGNVCGHFAGNHILMAAYLDEDQSYGFHYKYHAKMYKILNKPYERWGTYYILLRP